MPADIDDLDLVNGGDTFAPATGELEAQEEPAAKEEEDNGDGYDLC